MIITAMGPVFMTYPVFLNNPGRSGLPCDSVPGSARITGGSDGRLLLSGSGSGSSGVATNTGLVAFAVIVCGNS